MILDDFDLEGWKTDLGQVIDDVLIRRVRAQVADEDLAVRFGRRQVVFDRRGRHRRHADVPDVYLLTDPGRQMKSKKC